MISLQLVSKRFLAIARDANLWKHYCFQRSNFKIWEIHSDPRSRTPLPIPEPRVLELQRIVARSITSTTSRDSSIRDRNGTRRRQPLANWDPSYQSENVNWYEEYIARHAPLSISWLQQPVSNTGKSKDKREVRGLGLKNNGDRNVVVAPLDDGSICIWDIGRNDDVHDASSGRILARSKLILMANASRDDFGNNRSSEGNVTNPSVVECVSIDRVRNKGYFAVQSGLNEVDLETLQVISYENYTTTISALSDVSYPTPLTVGTGLGIHLHDPRLSHNAPSVNQELGRLDSVTNLPIFSTPSPQVWNDSSRIKGTGGRGSSGPLSILHQPSPGDGSDAAKDDIYVAGRFPSILIYDRRNYPKIRDSIWSGARISALALLAPVSGLSAPRALLAAGEYNGKGSLELHLPTPNSTNPSTSQFKNRTSASSSKLLSVISHGTRLLFSDSNGMLKWVERDGSTLVRRWNINQAQMDAPHHPHSRRRGIFSDDLTPAKENGGDVARKILGTGLGAKDGVVVWTGERIGVVESRKNPRGGEADDEEEMSIEDKERFSYGETMRLALERQADEVRFVRGLGLGR